MSHHFTHLTLTYSWACIIKTFWILNHVGAIGSLLGKLIIIINRYSVLRSTDLLEKMLFYGYKYANVNGVDVIYSFTDEGVTALCGTTLLLNMPEATDAVWRLYPYANGLATYTAPVVLVIFSSKVRCLFLPKNLFKSSSVERICGILSVLSFMTHHFTHLTLPPGWGWIIKGVWIINHFGAIGSLLGKLIIIINRYSVLRSSDFKENVAFYEYTYGVKDDGVQSSKAITTTYYAIYVVASVAFTVLTSRKFAKLSSIVGEGSTKQQIVKHQQAMFIIVAFCIASHLVKVVHQALWGVFTIAGRIDIADSIWPFYPYANGLATYTAPVVLMVFSSKVRHILMPRSWFRSSSVESATTTSELAPSQAYRI
ncbi:hypothetical protein PRIPAC_77933 [Pristionchus pacificus]|uniref:Serpentine receptor class gamma n=1 Tax=Pristionchus pacificus TaxID=54126 RepID=A0A2A6CLC9_PRIPA|nr:hypothetical protein PRIPAC_77933 [Pristionchus pacificus]|eukprot:PDM78919.1 G protein-coupled receptor [Pristionchus pacificus]